MHLQKVYCVGNSNSENGTAISNLKQNSDSDI